MDHYKFFQHGECEFFPCPHGVNPESFNCLFCYCPLFGLGDRCGGSFTYTADGMKDCSGCTYPHRRENYDKIMGKIPQLLELVKKKTDAGEKP